MKAAIAAVTILAAGICLAADTPAATGLAVQVISPRPGLLFTDREPVDVSARVTGTGGPVTVAYTLRDCAPARPGKPVWQADGLVRIAQLADGAGQQRLPVKLPGRGLYELNVAATSGAATAKAQTWIAVVFAPEKPDPASPWSIFYAPPEWFMKDIEGGARGVALSHRLLGASWSRLNFWAGSFSKVTVKPGDKPDVTYEPARWKLYARELRREGINIMGEIAQCPRELSSRPEETAVVGDAGPVYNRVKPADYRLWGRLMEQVAADFRDEIGVWEIWNEANIPNCYWTGTVEDFYELAKQTAAGLRRGNPKARIAAAGFVHGHDFADKLLGMGLGRFIDILSVHYTDETPSDITGYQALLKKHDLNLPIWNTEERSEIPLRNLAGGIERSFKFIHVAIGYPDLRPLIREDLTVLPAGITFSVGAHCIGKAKFVERSDRVPGWEMLYFRRGDETVVAFQRVGLTGLGRTLAEVTLAIEPLQPGVPPTVTDVWGRSTPLKVQRGKATFSLDDKVLIVNGCRKIGVVAAKSERGETAGVFEAEAGKWSPGWANSARDGFSGGRILEIWAQDDPGPDGYWVELKLTAPADGRYEVVFSGNGLARAKPPRSISPFVWSIDGGEEHRAEDAVPALDGMWLLPVQPSILGKVDLKKGEHTFRLRLTSRRDEPDRNWALWFDAILLR